jgi:hypothetical protein
MNLQQEMQKCIGNKDEDSCLGKVKQEYEGNKMKQLRADYEGYLDELIKRK